MHSHTYDYDDSYFEMASAEAFFTIAYTLIAACFVVPPTEFVSAGLTVQNLFSNYLGSEDLDFVHYHMRRTVITLVVHSCLLLGYLVGFSLLVYVPPLLTSLYWQLFAAITITLPLAAVSIAWHWSRDRWSHHPLARQLAVHNTQWQLVASDINAEVRRVDKFTSGPSGRRLIVTDAWLLKTSAYHVDVAHQADVHLTLVDSENHALHHEMTSGGGGAQFLNIDIRGIAGRVKPFSIRLNALEYNDLKNKLRGPIRNVRNIVIRQSLSERFLETFRQLVSQNPVCVIPADLDLEPCIGCMQRPAGVCLRRMCTSRECTPCACRPMWCVDCMGRWFASRQDQGEPGTWLSGRAPCPTCRSPFCMLDICAIF